MKPKPKSSFVCLFSPTMYPELGPKCLRGEKAKFPRGVFTLGHNCNFRRKFTIRAAICKFYLNFFQVPLDLHSVLCYHLRNQYSQKKNIKNMSICSKNLGGGVQAIFSNNWQFVSIDQFWTHEIKQKHSYDHWKFLQL